MISPQEIKNEKKKVVNTDNKVKPTKGNKVKSNLSLNLELKETYWSIFSFLEYRNFKKQRINSYPGSNPENEWNFFMVM